MTKKWVRIHGKWDLVRVSGEFELPDSTVSQINDNII